MNQVARKAGWVFFWILTVFEALMMGVAGLSKFNGTMWQEMFVQWGYPAAFATFIGVCEVAGAMGVLIPRLAPFAASGLLLIMLGALYTVLTRENELGWGGVIIHLVLLTLILAVRLRSFTGRPAPSPSI